MTYLAQIIPQIDFGPYTPFITAILAIVINIIRKWLDGIPADKESVSANSSQEYNDVVIYSIENRFPNTKGKR